MTVQKGRKLAENGKFEEALHEFIDVALDPSCPSSLVHEARLQLDRIYTRLGPGGLRLYHEAFYSIYLKAINKFRARRISIIIPVYNAPEETAQCIRSLVATVGNNSKYRIILIDDASPAPDMQPLVYDTIPRLSNIEVHQNDRNLGFTATINKGIELAKDNDIVILNSDTIVSERWIIKLGVTAYLSDRIGTVTPVSNNAGPFSIPRPGQENSVPGIGIDGFSRALSYANSRFFGDYFQSPTGHGFCMYMKASCLMDVGKLDADAFPRGYGEENDFCIRAEKKGWLNTVSTKTYIYHKRSASFGGHKKELLEKGRSIIDLRYPFYTESVRRFIASTALGYLEEHANNSLESYVNPTRRRILFVLPMLSPRGGTPQTNEDLMSGIQHGFETFVLLAGPEKHQLLYYDGQSYSTLKEFWLTRKLQPFPHNSDEVNEFAAYILWKYAIDIIHIRHILWQGLRITEIAKTLEIPLVLSFHDYYCACPSLKLLDDANQFCGGNCTRFDGDCNYDLWENRRHQKSQLPKLKHGSVYSWRDLMKSLIQSCDAFVTTDQSAKEVLVNIFPEALEGNDRFHVIPHGRDFVYTSPPKTHRLISDRRLRVLVPGAITVAKGGLFLQELSAATQGFAEFHILGKLASEIPSMPDNVYIHGEYDRSDFVEKANSINADIGAIFSIWPETYCHTLTELLAAGLPVLGFDIGAVGSRINEGNIGWRVAVNNLEETILTLEKLHSNPQQISALSGNLRIWQETIGASRDCAWMASKYIMIYRHLLRLEVI